ncbi:MAG: 4-hydroxythreonine-4-phosphate dehydrogenase PdxA [Anaerolineae bacterium]
MTVERRPLLAVTMGDPAGVGPEVVVKALANARVRRAARALVIGDAATLRAACEVTGVGLRVDVVESPATARFARGALTALDLHNVDVANLQRGRVSAEAGAAAYAYIEHAVQLALGGQAAAVVTAPLNKEALNLAGHFFAGHTELLASLCGVRGTVMMLVGGALRVTHVSTHVALREACERVRRERIVEVARLTADAIRRLGFPRPRLAVAGLNPHAGEGGLFGREEQEEIAPAVAALQQEGLDVVGPLPPDTVFWRCARREFDAVIAMYHDQGHIPLKLLAFDEGVNVTLGLPIIRTSVDHGTAFDIAWTGVARPDSMVQALLLAARMAGNH